MLFGFMQAQDEGPFNVLNTTAYNLSAPGVLSGVTGGDAPYTAHLAAQASHGTATVNADGSWSYTANVGFVGQDSFQYDATDTNNDTSNQATVTLIVGCGVLSDVDQTKLPADTMRLPMQILGTSSGQPATAGNLSLVYNSSTAQPTQILEQDFQPSMSPAASTELGMSATFNGTQESATFASTSNLTQSNPIIRLSVEVDTSGLPTGRYADSQTVSAASATGPGTQLSTLDGAANVVNDQSSPFGAGWDMPGLYHVYQNTAANVPAGVLLTTGDGDGWYFTQAGGNSYTSPNGPEAFSTLVGLSGGGWQLTNQYGTVYTFNSSGYLTSTELRTTATTTYAWTGGDLTSITDPFGRSVLLAYSGGRLSDITDYAGSVWNFAYAGSTLTGITEPTVAAGTPVWTFGYTGDLLTSVEDPNSTATSYTFDAYNNLSSETLPGGAQESYVSEQDSGFGQTPASPANAVLASTVFNTTTDPDRNTSQYQTDKLDNITTYVSPYGAVTTYTRDANGLMTQLTQPPPAAGDAAPVTNYTYDALGNQTSATGANPTYGATVYNTFSEPVSFTDSTGDEWVWSYDTHGNLLSETLPSGDTTSYTVDTLGNRLSMTQPAPNDATGTVTTTYTRDPYERLTKITFPDNSTETFVYNTIDLPTSVTDEDNHTSQTAYNALGWVTSETAADGGVTAYTQDLDGNILTTQDALGNVTSNVWNGRNELTQQTLPAPAAGQSAAVLSWTYDANGNELTYTDGMGRVESETWDKLNRLASQSLPAQSGSGSGPTTDFGYDALSRKVSETNALSGTTTWAYANTDVNQVTSVTLPPPSGSGSGPETNYFYDADGRQNQVENALGQYTTTTFTPDGQTANVKDNLGNITSYVYGHGQELLSTTDALNHTSSDEYDSRYRLIQNTNAAGGVTQITLDPAGNEIKLVDPDGNATTWTYSEVNLPLTETNSLGTTTTTYNLDQQTTSIQDADGRMRDFVYDDDGRLTAENWMSGTTVVASMNYGYDLDSELTSASDPNSAYAFAYNGDGEATSVNNAGTPNVPNVILTDGYDLLGDRTSLSATIAGTADFANTYSYDGDQNLTMVQQQGVNGGNAVSQKEIDYGYNALGQFSTVVDYNFIGVGPRLDVLTGAYSYDNDARLTGIAYTSNAGATTIDTLGWGYDAASNVTSFTSIDGTADYGYDPTNQLTSATYVTASGGHQPANENFSFDANGNRNMSGYTTGGDNLMSSDGTYNYQHDADGNTISRAQIASTYSTQYLTTYTWDYRNRLTDVEYYDNNDVLTKHVHYVYGVFDHLLATEVDPTGGGTYTQIEHYVLDVSPQIPVADVPGTALAQPVLNFDENGNLTQRNLVALNPAAVDAVVAQESVNPSGDVVTWTADGHLGSPVDVVNNSGVEADHIVRSAFGQAAFESNSAATPWAGFGGGHFDPNTGLVNDYHRWLAAVDGDWLNQDPSGFRGGDANLSRDVGNTPTTSTDITGLFTLFGKNWVMPWDPNAAGISETASAMAEAAEVAAAGTAAGAAAGATTGAIVGGIGGACVGGVGAAPGAAGGAIAGGIGGAIAGLISAATSDTPGEAAQSGAVSGAISGLVGGAGSAVQKALAAKAAAQAAAAQEAALQAAAAQAAAEGAATAAEQAAAAEAVSQGTSGLSAEGVDAAMGQLGAGGNPFGTGWWPPYGFGEGATLGPAGGPL